MSAIVKAVTELLNKDVIHVVAYRSNKRTGLDIPVYSTIAKEQDRLDVHSLLAGVTSQRLVIYDFVSRNLLPKSEHAVVIDIGSGRSGLATAIARFGKNFRVFRIDIAEPPRDAIMDARSTGIRSDVVDQVICISALEHIGLSCGISDESGDIKAMGEIFRILKKGGSAIVSVPCGSSHKRSHRVYERKKLDALTRDFSILRKEFYRYDAGRWKKCSQVAADNTRAKVPDRVHSAACVCLLLQKVVDF